MRNQLHEIRKTKFQASGIHVDFMWRGVPGQAGSPARPSDFDALILCLVRALPHGAGLPNS